jgi:PAS domain S-box-containing protein/putative nucleotidyltransferase with HDIG domain
MPKSEATGKADLHSKRMKAGSNAGGIHKNTRQTFEALVNCSPLAIIAVDPTGNVTVWNPAAERIFGWKVQEVLGGPNPVIPPEKQKEFHSLLKSIMRGEACSDVETTGRRKDGSDLNVRISASPVFHARGEINGVMAVINDITEQKLAEEELRKSESRFRGLFNSTLDGVYQTDATGVFTVMNHAGARIFGYESPEEIIGRSVLEYWRDPKDRDAFVAELSARKSVGSYHMPARKKDGEYIELEASSRLIEDEKGDLLGIEGILRDVTEHKQADQHLRQLLERSTALYAGSKTMTESLEVGELAGSITRACVEKLGVAIAWIGRAESDGSVSHVAHFPLKSSYPERITVRWDDTPLGRGSTGRAIRSGRPIAISHISKDEELAPWHDAAREEGIISLATFPLISRGRTFGVLKLYSDRPGFFTEEYIQFFQTYAHQAAAAIENARLFQETEYHLEHLRALRAIDLAITSSLDLRVTLDVLLDNVTSQLNVDAAAVLLLNPYSKLLEYTAGRGFHTRALQYTRLQIGQGYAGQAVTERRTIKVLNVTEADGFSKAPMLKEEGFICYFAVPLVAKGHVKGVLEIFHRKPLNPDEQWVEFLDALAGQTAIAVDNAALFNDLERSNAELTMAYETTLDGWSRALDLRDKETEGHTQRVAEMTLHLAKAIGMSDEELVHVRRGALLHDIGKMGIPDSILLKPGKLTDEEWDIMRKHPVYAYELLYPIAYLRRAVDIPYCHHEKWDGTGYPRGLKGEQIPLAARIFAVMDVWDALRSDRPYRAAWPEEKTLEHIRALSGSHFDPRVVEIFLKIQW